MAKEERERGVTIYTIKHNENLRFQLSNKFRAIHIHTYKNHSQGKYAERESNVRYLYKKIEKILTPCTWGRITRKKILVDLENAPCRRYITYIYYGSVFSSNSGRTCTRIIQAEISFHKCFSARRKGKYIRKKWEINKTEKFLEEKNNRETAARHDATCRMYLFPLALVFF